MSPKTIYVCEHCGLPAVVDSTSRPGTYVCRTCGSRFSRKPKQFQRAGWKAPFFLGIAVGAVALLVVISLKYFRVDVANDSVEQSSPKDIPQRAVAPQNANAAISRPKPAELPPTSLSKNASSRQIYEMANLSVVAVISLDESLEKRSIGTGFYVSRDGLIVTNLHVVADSTFVDVVSTEGTVRSTGFAAADPETDLAIIKIDREVIPLKINPSLTDIGSKVFAIGNPEGFRMTISDGIVSGRRKLVDLNNEEVCQLIQTTAAVSHGSSGGPLISEQGEVVGVISSGWAEGQNLNFAIASLHVSHLLAQVGQLRDFALLPKKLKSNFSGNLLDGQ